MGGERERFPPHYYVEPVGARGFLSLHPSKIPVSNDEFYSIILALVRFTRYLNFLDKQD